uniref:Uncharacterized protein n=1 Tax=Rhodosorus marinus TaxID=101924 RepID=A0A7S3ECK6_9RHOD|mmetsp:Transcript_22157/g.89717  ORF Transcript_22157/g.89717 Transcript_22157/m.89717 type:complete len:127 (+) Transcript_22157:1309-1689(+)
MAAIMVQKNADAMGLHRPWGHEVAGATRHLKRDGVIEVEEKVQAKMDCNGCNCARMTATRGDGPLRKGLTLGLPSDLAGPFRMGKTVPSTLPTVVDDDTAWMGTCTRERCHSSSVSPLPHAPANAT